MIAVWLVGPPSRVASATTRSGSRPAVSAGARSSATSTDGSLGAGMPGSGWPVSSATIRSRMSCRSVTRSAISPPIERNSPANWSTAPTVACTASVPLRMREEAAESRPRSAASVAVALSTSLDTPLASAERPLSRSATAAAAAAKRSASVARASSGELHRRGQRRRGRRPDDRPVAGAGHHRGAAQGPLAVHGFLRCRAGAPDQLGRGVTVRT